MGMDWGAFAGGVGKGLQGGAELWLRANESKLKTKMLEHQMKVQEFEQGEKQRKATEEQRQAQELGRSVEDYIGSITGGQPSIPGYESPEQQISVAPVPAQRGPKALTPEQVYTAGAMRQGKFFAPSATSQQRAYPIGPGGALTDVTGKELYRNPAERQALGAESRQFADYQRARQAEGWTTDQIREGWRGEVGATSGVRAGGAEAGRQGVRSTPGFQQTERNVAQARKEGATVAEAKEQLPQLAGAMDLVNELDELSKNVFTTSKQAGWLQRGTGAAGEFAKSFDPSSLEGIYEARKQTVGENLARQIGGVKGTATEGDIYRMLVALPKVGRGETSESRTYKIGAFRQAIQRAIINKQRFIAGEPVDLEASRREFRVMVDKLTGSGGSQGRLVPKAVGR